jgi:hypothetical protein
MGLGHTEHTTLHTWLSEREPSMNRQRYDRIESLAPSLSDLEISRRLHISRPSVQRYRWLTELPKYVRDAFLRGQYPERFVFSLWQKRDSRRELRAFFKSIPQRQFTLPITKTVGEIRNALRAGQLDKRTLRWVLNG